jgi:hypothetical protein
VVVIAGDGGPQERRCSATCAAPAIPAGELAHRTEQELTEAAFRGVGVVVLRDGQAAWPELTEALGLAFQGDEPAGTVDIRSSAVSDAATLTVADGVELKLAAASAIGEFAHDEGVAAAVHPFGLGAAVAFGFDPSRSEPSSAAARLLASAVAFVAPETALAPRGTVAIGVDVTNEGTDTTTRVREELDPALAVVDVLSGGQRLPSGEIEWQLDQPAGATDRLAYVVRLPPAAGTYRTTTEVASLTPAGVRVDGTYSLELALGRGEPEVLAEAERLALELPAKGPDASNRQKILAALASVRGNPGTSAADRERAIGDLLSAVDDAKALRSVDPTPLRLELGALLAAWEARP